MAGAGRSCGASSAGGRRREAHLLAPAVDAATLEMSLVVAGVRAGATGSAAVGVLVGVGS
jgi:hypothetical protein